MVGSTKPAMSSSSSSKREEDACDYSHHRLKLALPNSDHAVSPLNFFMNLKEGVTRKSSGLISYLLVDCSLRYSLPNFVQDMISRWSKNRGFLIG